jgi:tetratricopeptide (TPR) repeat protein
VSPRGRIVALTALCAVLAAIGAIAVGALQGESPEAAGATPTTPATPARTDPPPLGLDLGVRDDAEARTLRRAQALYTAGDLDAAKALFDHSSSLEARVGSAFAAWPAGTTRDRLEQLAGLHPSSAVVLLHLGIARTWSGAGRERAAWQAAADAEPDSPYRVTADNLLYPTFARGIPVFVPTADLPAGFSRLAPAAQLATLERQARTVDGKLLYGAALQRLGRQVSASRVFAAAARQRPGDDEARAAAAVGRFTKARPVEAFSRLGPLTRRFPRSASVRFHLGLLLLWSGQVKEAKRQLALAQTAQPGSPLAREAAKYLAELRKAGI